MTAPFNPEELCDQTLIGSIRMLMKDDSVFPEIFSAAFENRNANNLVFSIPSDLSITGKQIDVIADRAHLLKESQYRPHEWNAWPDVIPPRLDTEPAINGETRECDYWLVKLKNGSYRTGKITKDKYWVRFENQIAAYREFSPRPAEAVLENQTEFDPGGWNAYPKFNPDSEEVYEVMLKGGLVKAEEPFMVIPGDDNLLELESMRDAAGITQNLYSALDAVSDNFDLCIIDCSPSADVRQLIALSLSTHYLIPFQVKSESISGVEKTLARAKVIQENVNNSLEFLGLLMSMVKMQGIQKKNFEWVIEQTQNLLLKKYEPKTGKFEGVCCIYDRSEYTAAQQFCRPVFFSENGKPRREALELARVWVSIFKQLGLTPQKQIQIKKSEDSDKLVAVDVQPVAEP